MYTEYGPTTIETYACDSCESTVPFNETVQFTMGSRKGRVCQHCEEEGPVSLPVKVIEWGAPYDQREYKRYTLATYIGLGFILLPTSIFAAFVKDNEDFIEGYGTAALAAFIWTFILWTIWIII